mgnify:CR=1 FL=1
MCKVPGSQTIVYQACHLFTNLHGGANDGSPGTGQGIHLRLSSTGAIMHDSAGVAYATANRNRLPGDVSHQWLGVFNIGQISGSGFL